MMFLLIQDCDGNQSGYCRGNTKNPVSIIPSGLYFGEKMSELETVVIRIMPKNKILLVNPMLDTIVTIQSGTRLRGGQMGRCHLTIFRRFFKFV